MAYQIITIGVSQYRLPAYPNLNFAARDATEFHSLMKSNLPVTHDTLLTDGNAGITNVHTALSAPELKAANPDDVFILFYSGHGAAAKDDKGELQGYLVPHDATEDIPSSSLSVDVLRDFFEQLPHKTKVMFIDSCYSGSANSKSVASLRTKDLTALKSLQNQITSEGSLVFTACGEKEEALEFPALKHGLFTYALIGELEKERSAETFPLSDIYTPISDVVKKKATEAGYEQTPEIKTHLKSPVLLPSFKRRPSIAPDRIDFPATEELRSASFEAPKIKLSDKEMQNLLDGTMKLVRGGNELEAKLAYERYLIDSVSAFKSTWEEQFKTVSQPSELPDAVAKVEAKSLQFIVLGVVTALIGTQEQMQIYSERVADILSWQYGRAGLVALIHLPEIVVTNVIYIVGMISLATKNLKPFKILSRAYVYEEWGENDPHQLRDYSSPHYCQALGGSATSVCDHVISVLQSYTWLPELLPQLEGKLERYFHQVNLIIALQAAQRDIHFYPNYGRYYADKVMPLVNRLKTDATILVQVADYFGVKPEELRAKLRETHKQLQDVNLGTMTFWNSITADNFLTVAEKKKLTSPST